MTRAQRLQLALLPPIAAFLLRALGSTLRFEERTQPHAQPADRDPTAPDVYVFWHRALLLAAWRYRSLNIRILISPSFDGELIARVVERLGFTPVRGSSSRGGAAGLLALTRARIDGRKVAITADGPRGPVYQAKPGAALAAQRARSTASCFHLHPHSAWVLRSWDGFLIPKPFSRVTVAWTDPVQIPAEASPAEATALVQHALAAAVHLAES